MSGLTPGYQTQPANTQLPCYYVYHVYVFDVVMAASGVLNNQQKSISTDADFLLRSLTYASTGIFSARFADPQGFFLSDNNILSAALSPDGGRPYVFFPEVFYPAGGAIRIDLTELSAAQNSIQLSFRGVKRIRR